MENLAASHNDKILVINRSLTVRKDKHGILGVRGSLYYYILGSVDIKHTAKNICTSQKCISWSYFLTCTENKSIHFGTKVVLQWLEKKFGRITIQNMTNC